MLYQQKIDKKARKLMNKYPNYITPKQLIDEIPNEKERREIFSRMVYLAQCDKDNEIFG